MKVETKNATGKLKECIDNITPESLAKTKAKMELEEAADRYAVNKYNQYCNDPSILENIDGDELLRKTFKDGAIWQKKQTINEVCKWLEDHLFEYDQYSVISIDAKEVVDDLKKAMEE